MEKEFNTVPVSHLVIRLGIPAMLAQLFNILYSIVDRIFVGNIDGSGELALASIGICAPAVTAITAFSFMIGIGGSALMSISMGRGDKKTASRSINNALVMLITIGVVLTLTLLLFKREILYFLGSSDNMYPYASSYFTIYVSGTCAALIGMGMNQFILAQGYAKAGMVSVVMGALANVILDPIFIFGLGMGISGAALATVISQIMSMVFVLVFLSRKSLPVHIGLGDYKLKIMYKILSIGSMSFLITILDNLILILLNINLRKYGGDALGDKYIACAAVVQSFMVIVFCPAQGITTGCSTLYGYHYGAKNFKKAMEVFKYVFILCASYIGVLLICSQTVPYIFVRLFTSDTENIALASEFVSKYTLGMLGVAVQYAVVDGLTAMSKVRYAFPLSVFRKLVFVACIFILPLVTRLENIFYAGTISDIIGSLFTLTVFFSFVRPRLRAEMEGM